MKKLVKVLLVVCILVWMAVGVTTMAQAIMDAPEIPDYKNVMVTKGMTLWDLYIGFYSEDVHWEVFKSHMYLLNEEEVNELKSGWLYIGQTIRIPVYK